MSDEFRNKPRKGNSYHTKRLSIKISEEDLATIHKAADDNKMAMSDFVMFACKYVISKNMKIGFVE